MNKINLQNLKGFRDFLPNEKVNRDYVKNSIEQTFLRFGFEPLETPTLESADLLLGKYGDEADKLVYTFEDKGGRKVGLRYDQTVPTARVLSQYSNILPSVFKRYQIQNVFRADKPQKGRFREFTQCDIDIFGSKSIVADSEIIACSYKALTNLGFKPKVIINDRQVLFKTLEQRATQKVSVLSIIQTIDKLDKVSVEEVINELQKKGLSKFASLSIPEDIKNAKMSENLKEITKLLENYNVRSEDIVFTPYLARGLDYYTGMIFEIKVEGIEIGSLAGGGRYDNLIKDLGGPNIPAVGVSFGFDRIVEALTISGMMSPVRTSTQVLVSIFSKENLNDSVKLVSQIRQNGILAEIYPDESTKLEKQLKYADKKGINFVLILGPDEIKNQQVVLKDMQTKTQKTLTIDEVCKLLQE